MNIGDAVSMLTAGILESSAPRVIPAAKETSGTLFGPWSHDAKMRRISQAGDSV